MEASASRGWPARVPSLEPEPEASPDRSQLPLELLLMMLRHLFECCSLACSPCHALVDRQALWLLILAPDH